MSSQTRAFVMADIAGSSRMWNHESLAMSNALARHDEIAEAAIASTNGDLFKHTGDGFLAAFPDTAAALDAMATYQADLAAERWPEPIRLRSRVAVHWGPAEARLGDFFGPTINHLARITDLVEPTHVVATGQAVGQLHADDQARPLDALGSYSAADVPKPVLLCRLSLPSSVGPALTNTAGHGLPSFSTTLTGRDDELGRIVDRLGTTRLLTLVGFGGTGKTRLAVEAGHRWAADTGGRVFFVDLASTDEVATAIGAAVGLGEEVLARAASPMAAVADHLSSASSLVVVDNCEHLIEEAADSCAELIDRGRHVRILATSREPLEIDSEQIQQVEPLTPESARDLLVARMTANDLALPAPDVLDQLVAAVDALPLGIELVGSRLRTMHADELLTALESDQSVLEPRRRSRRRETSTPGRHRTLRSVISWSYELLDPDEQSLLLRLSRLPAPATRSTSRALAPRRDTELVEELDAKSLLSRDDDGRYRMLQSIRRYCDDRLDADPDTAREVDDTLVDWALVESPPITTTAGAVFDRQRARELDELSPNLRAALAAAGRLGRRQDRAGIVTGLWMLGIDVDARRWYDEAVATALDDTDDPALSAVLIAMSFQGQVGDHADQQRLHDLSARLDRIDPSGSSPVRAMFVINEAVGQMVAARVFGLPMTDVRTKLSDAVRVAVPAGHTLEASLGSLYLGFSHLLEHDPGAAMAHLERAADDARRCQFDPLVGLAECAIGVAHLFDGDAASARDITTMALPMGSSARWESSMEVAHIAALLRCDDRDEARRRTADLIERAARIDNPFVTFDTVTAVAAVHVHDRAFDAARAALAHASVTRTPLSLSVLFDAATTVEHELVVDQFADVLDPQAFTSRAAGAAAFLHTQQGSLAA